jgi:hypothetical protein
MTDHEEWLSALTSLSEIRRAATEVEIRHSMGMCGDSDDALCD